MIQLESISGTFKRERALQAIFPIRVLVIKEGRGWLCMNSGDYRIRNGRVFFIPEEGLVRLDGQIEAGYWLTFASSLYTDFLLQHLDPLAKTLFLKLSYEDLDGESTKAYGLLDQLQRDIEANKDLPFLSQSISLFLGYASGLDGYLAASSLDELQQILRFRAILEQFYKRERYGEFYAQGMGMGIQKLKNFVLRVLGKSLSSLIRDRVMREAEHLLSHNDYTIDEIAEILGFEQTKHLYYNFKRYKGMSIVQFKKAKGIEN